MALEPVDINIIVSQVRAQMEEELQQKQAEVHVMNGLPTVLGHYTTCIQIFTNLVSNAIKFVPPNVKPKVIIRAETNQNNFILWIEDNGIGIKPEYHDKIFGVFERLHGVESYPGTGIGLAMVRKGVERMNGQCGVDSELGKGSKFWIQLQSV